MEGGYCLSENIVSQFKAKLQLNYMDYLIPYGLIQVSPSNDTEQYNPHGKDAKDAAAIHSEADEIMGCVNKIHESLSKDDLDFKYIEFLNHFAKPLDVVLDAYDEVEHSINGNKPDMLQVMNHMINNPEHSQIHALVQSAKKESTNVSSDKPSVLAEIAESRERLRNTPPELRDKPDPTPGKKKSDPDL